jgi:hypothetical protein
MLHKFRDLLHPFHDRNANSRFLALALGGMLCSIATLIHDSFLGVFMRDQLGMTNTVRLSIRKLLFSIMLSIWCLNANVLKRIAIATARCHTMQSAVSLKNPQRVIQPICKFIMADKFSMNIYDEAVQLFELLKIRTQGFIASVS